MTPISLGELCAITMGQAPEGSSYNDDGNGLPLIAGASDFGLSHPQPSRFTSAPTKIAEDKDIIICVRATIGDLNWADRRYCLGRGVAGIRPKQNICLPSYIWWALNYKSDILRSKGRGATFKQISKTDIEELEISVPPLDEQRRIAAILDQADDLRRKRRAALERADGLRNISFLNLFGDPLRNERGWATMPFGEVGSLDRGISKHRPRNDPALLGGIYPLIQTGDVTNSEGRIQKYISTYSEAGLRQSKIWPRGTLCITIAANIGRTGILDFDACFPDSVVGFTPGPDCLPEYVQTWIEFIQPQLEADAPQFAQKNINLNILRNLSLPIPPIALQRAFAVRVAEIHKLKASHRAHLARLDTLFASLQHRAFRGEF